MWRDQLNYFTRQIIKSQCFYFYFYFFGLEQGAGIYIGSSSNFSKKSFNWLCAKMSFANLQHTQCILNRNWSEPIFICDFVFCHSEGRLDSCSFGIVHQPNSVTTVLLHYEIESSLCCTSCISVCIPVSFSWCGPLLPPAVSHIRRTAPWGHLSCDFITDVLWNSLFLHSKG